MRPVTHMILWGNIVESIVIRQYAPDDTHYVLNIGFTVQWYRGNGNMSVVHMFANDCSLAVQFFIQFPQIIAILILELAPCSNRLIESIGGSKGGTRDTCPPSPRPQPPGGQNSFIFMQYSAKNMQNNPNLGVGTSPSGKSWIHHWNPLFHKYRFSK